jgi:hypothetical protein
MTKENKSILTQDPPRDDTSNASHHPRRAISNMAAIVKNVSDKLWCGGVMLKTPKAAPISAVMIAAWTIQPKRTDHM